MSSESMRNATDIADRYAELRRRLDVRGYNVVKLPIRRPYRTLENVIEWSQRPVHYSRQVIAWAVMTGRAIRLPIEKNIRFWGAL